MSSPIVAKVKLGSGASAIPAAGLSTPRLRVELAETEKQNSAWIAELIVLGDLPWHKGEERYVELRIMSDEFRNYVTSERPNLLVKRGDEIIGELNLQTN